MPNGSQNASRITYLERRNRKSKWNSMRRLLNLFHYPQRLNSLRNQNENFKLVVKSLRKSKGVATKHLKNDCPDRPPDGENSPRGEKKWDGEKKSKFVKKFESSPKKEKKEFPLRSAMKGKNKSRSSNNFFDSNGDGDDSGESSSMIFCCEIPDEELAGIEEGEEYVMVTARMDAAFQAACCVQLTGNWFCIDTACNVDITNFLPNAISNYVETRNAGVNTAGQGGRLRIQGTYSWGDAHGIKYCPEARSNLLSSEFITKRQCDILLSSRYSEDVCKLIVTTLRMMKTTAVELYMHSRVVVFGGFSRNLLKISFAVVA